MNAPSTASQSPKNTRWSWRALSLVALSCALIAAIAVRAGSDETSSGLRLPTFPLDEDDGHDDSQQTLQMESFRQWEVFLDNMEPEIGRDSVEKLLAGSYRDRCTITLGGSGSQMDVYLLDDFHELHFHFDVVKGLVSKGIYKRTRWLRFPNGRVERIKEDR